MVEQIMLREWENVKDKLGYPNLKDPSIISGDDTAFINMNSKEIFIYDGFIKRSNLDLGTFFKGVLAHEANHYVTLPYDLKTNILLNLEASKVSKKQGAKLANYFNDVVINLDLIKRGIVQIADVYKDMNSNSNIDKSIKCLYNVLTGLDFGNFQGINQELVYKLSLLNYDDLEIKSLRQNCFNFSKLLVNEVNNQEQNYDTVIFEQQSTNNVLDEIVEELEPYEITSVNNSLNTNMGLLNFYDSLTNNYLLNIQKNPSSNNFGFSIKDWEPGMDISSINKIKSKGKYLPSITKYEEITNRGEYKVPELNDCTIFIDSSLSMQDPSQEKSDSVISAFSIAKHYLSNKKNVGVVNFSNQTLIQPHTLNKQKILEHILLFQNSGTLLELETLDKKLLDKKDIYLISDMDIQNLDNVYNFFNKLNSNVNFFNICLEDSFELKGNINYYKLSDTAKLPSLVLNKMRDTSGI